MTAAMSMTPAELCNIVMGAGCVFKQKTPTIDEFAGFFRALE